MPRDRDRRAAAGTSAGQAPQASPIGGRAGEREAALEWWRLCLERLFAEAPEAVEFEIRSDGRVAWMCGNLQRLLGLQSGSVCGLPLQAFADASSCDRILAAGIEGCSPVVLHFRSSSGSPLSVRSVTLQRSGMIHVLGVLAANCDRIERDELHAVNSQLAVTSRELARQRRQLESMVAEARTREAELRSAYTAIEKIARTDPLTGLHNRRALDDELPHLLEQSQQARRPLSVLVVDLDHFKQINDRFGHETGDLVLAKAAAALRRGVREHDLAVRLGGEEMLVVLPGAAAERAIAVADNLCAAIERLDFGALDVSVTASIGVATWVGPDDSVGTLLARADAAMYCAKAQGRNRSHFRSREQDEQLSR